MGSGISTGDNRAVEAAHAAISSPLLDDVSISGAQGVLVNITGGPTMSLFEVEEATEIIHEAAETTPTSSSALSWTSTWPTR